VNTNEEEIVVRCNGLTKSYVNSGNVTVALRGIDLEVRRGELLMLVGPSGCGKTTLISILACVLDHDGGFCEVLGLDIKKFNDKERSRFRGRSVGFVFQAFNLLPSLNAAENIAVPLIIQGKNIAEAVQHSDSLLEQVGMPEKAKAYPRELSGGQQQRVAIARALVHKPALVVCDEPTSALDAQTGHKVMELFRELVRESGKTLIVVTHDNRIFEFADRIAYMEDGRIIKVVEQKEQ